VKYQRILFYSLAVALSVWILYGYKCYYDYTYEKLKYRLIENLVPEKYRLRDTADSEWLLFNSSGLTETEFDSYYSKACYFDSLQQTDSSRYYFRKILSHHDSPNEREYEKIFSCGNDYWEYKNVKWMKYSKACEKTGDKEMRSALKAEREFFKNN
jgi:hypothetical protein